MSKTQHPITDELLDQLLANYQNPEDLIGADGILKQLTKKLVERALDAELTHHLGHDKHQPVSNPTGNTRNGFSKKKLKGEFGELPIEVPRDRHGTFDPQIVEKHQTRWAGFDDKILSLYARGMTVREIQAHLQEMYGAEVSPSLISSVTDAVVEQVVNTATPGELLIIAGIRYTRNTVQRVLLSPVVTTAQSDQHLIPLHLILSVQARLFLFIQNTVGSARSSMCPKIKVAAIKVGSPVAVRAWAGPAVENATVRAGVDGTVEQFTLRKGELAKASTRGVWLSESFAEQDGWLVHEERIRLRDWMARLPPANGNSGKGRRTA